MNNPVSELRGFLQAALFTPVPRADAEIPTMLRRRRIVVAVTLVLGAGTLALALRVEPGDPRFYWGTALLAGVWAGGAFLSGPLHLGQGHTRTGERLARPVVQSLALGTLLLGVFLLGAVGVARIPFLAEPVTRLLDYASVGSLTAVIVITAVNGLAEELFFRGALFAAVERFHPVVVTTLVYAATTAASGILLLVVAGTLLGVITGLQRRVTRGILGPTITHLVWSLGMLLLLPPMLAHFGG